MSVFPVTFGTTPAAALIAAPAGVLTQLDFLVIGLYLLLLVGIGYWVSFRKKGRQEGTLFLAGNSLRWPSIGFTMWGTNVGPSMLIASASAGFTTGIVAGNFAWYAFPFIFLLAAVFAPRYLGARVLTLPEFMGKRFGDSTRNILAWYTIVTVLISWLSLTLFAGGILVQQIIGFPIWLSALLLVILAAFFTIAGGLKAIAYTNVFQMAFLIVVSLVLTLTGLEKAGGALALFENTPSSYWNMLMPANDANYPWIAILLGYPVMGVWFWCTDQSMVQPVLGARSLREGQLGANFTAWLKILDVPLFIIPGILCFMLFPDLKDPDEAYMTMVTRLFPAGMTGIVMAVLIAALVSTIDSALNALGTVFTMDIYVKKYHPDARPAAIVRTGRIVAAAGAVIAILIVLAIDNIKGLNLFDVFQSVLGFIAPPMSVVFLFGIAWKKMTTRAANLVLLGGTLFSLGTGILYLWVFPSDRYAFWPHFLLLSFFIFLVLALAAFLVSWFDPDNRKPAVAPTAPAAVRQSFDITAPQSFRAAPIKVKLLWAALFLVMIGLYLFFNGH